MQNIQHERQSWLKLGALLSFLFLYGILNIFGQGGDVKLNYDNPSVVGFMYVAQVIGVVLLFIVPSVLFSIFWTDSKIHYIGITKKPHPSTLLIAGFAMLMAMPTINWLSDLNQHMQLPQAFNEMETWMKKSESKAAELTEVFTKGTSISKLILNLFVMALMAALSEEIFFRGILQKVLIECTRNKNVAIWMGAALFSAFHMQFYGFIPRMLMGAYLGYLFLWSGSLWPGMVAHFLNNGIAVLLIWLSNRGLISVNADKIGIESNQFIYVITSVIFVTVSLFVIYSIENKKQNSISTS